MLTISDFKDSVTSACPLIELIVLFYYLLFMWRFYASKDIFTSPPPQKKTGKIILQVMQVLQKWSVTCTDGIKGGWAD